MSVANANTRAAFDHMLVGQHAIRGHHCAAAAAEAFRALCNDPHHAVFKLLDIRRPN